MAVSDDGNFGLRWSNTRLTEVHGLTTELAAFACSKLTTETLEQGMKYVQS